MRGLALGLVLSALAVAGCGAATPPLEDGWTELGNGLRVAIRPVADAKDVAVLATFAIGSDHDPAGQSGLAHLIEHLWITSAAGNLGARTADEWEQSHPGGAAAATRDGHTVCSTVVSPEELESELADIAARMAGLRIEQSDLDRELPRVLEQIAGAQSLDARIVATRAAADRLRPLPNGGRGEGVVEEVSNLRLEDLRDRCRRFYQPANARIVIAGAVDAAATLALVERTFSSLAAGERAPEASSPGPPRPGRVDIDSTAPIPAGYERGRVVCIAYPGPALSDADGPARFAFPFLWMKRMTAPGLVPLPGERDVLQFVVATGERPVDELLGEVEAGIRKLVEKAPSQGELDWMQKMMAGLGGGTLGPNSQSGQPSASRQAAFVALAPVFDRVDVPGLTASVGALTQAEFEGFATAWLAPERRVVVVAWGPVETPPSTPAPTPSAERDTDGLPKVDSIHEIRVRLEWDPDTQVGRWSVEGRDVKDEAALEKAVQDERAVWAKKGEDEPSVLIQADNRMPWSDIVKAVNVVKRCGIDKIEFAMGAPRAASKTK